MSVPAVVYLVNEWGRQPRLAAGEDGSGYPGTADLCRLIPGSSDLLSQRSAQDLALVADELYSVFAASDLEGRARALSAVVERHRLRVEVSADALGLCAVFEGKGVADPLVAGCLTSLYRFLDGSSHQRRLGVCAADGCVDVWFDAASRRPRRYCSDTCSSRARTAHHRSRHRA